MAFDYDPVVIGVGPGGREGRGPGGLLRQAGAPRSSAALSRAAPAPIRAPSPARPCARLRCTCPGYRSREMYGVAVELERCGDGPARSCRAKAAIEAVRIARASAQNLAAPRRCVSPGRGAVRRCPHRSESRMVDRIAARSATSILIATGSRPANPAGDRLLRSAHPTTATRSSSIETLPASSRFWAAA